MHSKCLTCTTYISLCESNYEAFVGDCFTVFVKSEDHPCPCADCIVKVMCCKNCEFI